MIFRQARADEFDAVMAIIEDGRAALKGLGIDQWQGPGPTPDMVRDDMAAGCTYVAEADAEDAAATPPEGGAQLHEGELLGTLALVCTGEADYALVREGAWLTESPNSPAEGVATYATIHRVAASARARRRGVAKFMLKSALDLSREFGLVSARVDTHEGNGPMQHTLEVMGFTRCCVITITNPYEPTKKRIGYEIIL